MSTPQANNIAQHDKNMQIKTVNEQDFCFYSPWEAPFKIANFGWKHHHPKFNRLPDNPPEPITSPGVLALSFHTAGGQIKFKTDSTAIAIDVELDAFGNMDHMAMTGQNGFDLYLGSPLQQRFAGVTRIEYGQDKYTAVLRSNMSKKWREITINLPLYTGVRTCTVGLDKNAQIAPPSPYDSEQKIVFYGTSITQGGCASRPGMACSNILSRRFNCEIINLGFSGNGHGEPEMAHLINEIDAKLIVLDYEANCQSLEHLCTSLEEFLNILRLKNPTVKILVLSRPQFAAEISELDAPDNIEGGFCRKICRDKQYEIVQRHLQNGDKNLFFSDGGELFGEHFDECTVDGIHPNDLGFYLMADRLEPIIRQILTEK